MKIVCCAGGLGNQMFQYAFYRFLLSKGGRVYFDTSSKQLNRHTGFELKRVFPHIRIENKTAAPYFIRRVKHSLFALCWNNKFSFVGKDRDIDIRERQLNEKIFCGYWQQHGYINEMLTMLLNDLEFSPFCDDKNIETANHIAANNSVSIHIRRGDYLHADNVNTLGNVCSIEYYINAINFIKSKTENPEFIVFSDDMEWTKNNLPLREAVFVDWNKDKNAFRDMQLMSICKHNIIANSTFSWWAAWLNRNETKIVITPEKWLQSYLLPANWIKI